MRDNYEDGDVAAATTSDAADFEVLDSVMRALQPLSDERRRRILQTVATFFGHGAPQLTGKRPAIPGDHGQVASFSEDRAMSPKEFLLEKKPTTEIDRVACLGYYLTHYRDTPHFKTFDISKLNTEAAQIKLSNAARAVDNASKAGLLVAATKGSKQLSAIGEQYVQALPDRAAARAAVAGSRPRRKPKRPTKQSAVEEQ